MSKEKLEQKGQLPNVLDVVDEANAFDLISIPHTPDNDMDETNLTNPFEHENTNDTNKNTNCIFRVIAVCMCILVVVVVVVFFFV